MLNDRSTAKRRETTANDCLLHFMGQLLLSVEKDEEFGTTSQVVIEI
jgi:hypothetical protein